MAESRVESFHSRLRDECLGRELFFSVKEDQVPELEVLPPDALETVDSGDKSLDR